MALKCLSTWILPALLLPATVFAASKHIDLPDDSLVVTHASRHYQTGINTIAATLRVAQQAKSSGRTIVALGQYDIGTDPDWYGPLPPDVTSWFLSVGGEHNLYPVSTNAGVFHVTAIGGYHCACLGWTIAELVARFLDQPKRSELIITLPMEAIFTGFLRGSDGRLKPNSPEDESKADDSIDGLNLLEVTRPMDDAAFSDFMMEMLRWGVLLKNPLWVRDLTTVTFELARDGRVLRSFHGAPGEQLTSGPVVRFDYRR